ncbi:hypothetical protein [Bacillus weihaiensis]|uniref:Uncharacterized protein n=1 Tax=Bacillus weihaiensis TaxID=1547283 RepID=A0A1L3MVW3_9BACI|nr:hypothetical protein [Bacillus weihaiensis]APH06400.1 hypothetical protein A9C19_17595 [Bacillus weihaiensis]
MKRKLFSRSHHKGDKCAEKSKVQSMKELSDEEMKLIQGASKDMNESLYRSYALAAENNRMIP